MFGGNSVLSLAKANDCKGLSKYLSNHENLVNTPHKKSGQTALHLACKNGNLDMVLMLIFRGCDLNIKDHYNCAPLLVSLQYKHEDIAITLIERGAEINEANMWLETPLHMAARNNCSLAMIHLLTRGAQIDAKDHNADTAITLALLGGHHDLAMSLLEHGADYTIKNNHGESALTIAKNKNLVGMVTAICNLDDCKNISMNESMYNMKLDNTQSPSKTSPSNNNNNNNTTDGTNNGIKNSDNTATRRVSFDDHLIVTSTNTAVKHDDSNGISNKSDTTNDITNAKTNIKTTDKSNCSNSSSGSSSIGTSSTVKKVKPKRRFLERMLAKVVTKVSNTSGTLQHQSQQPTKYYSSGDNSAETSSATDMQNNSKATTQEGVINTTRNSHEECKDNDILQHDLHFQVSMTIPHTVSDTDKHTKKKKSKKHKIKRSLKKSAQTYNQINIEQETAILAMITPNRQRKTTSLMRTAKLYGLCVIM